MALALGRYIKSTIHFQFDVSVVECGWNFTKSTMVQYKYLDLYAFVFKCLWSKFTTNKCYKYRTFSECKRKAMNCEMSGKKDMKNCKENKMWKKLKEK